MSRKRKRRNQSAKRAGAQAEPVQAPSPIAVDESVVQGVVRRFVYAWEQIASGNLIHITLLYLALPLLLFLFGWLHLYYALPVATLLLMLLLVWGGDIAGEVRPANGNSLLICGLVALLWTGISGVGGFGFQTFDYIKHNAVLRALTFNEWPVMLSEDASLVFTIGYYLPAAAVGKLFGWTAANLAIFLWSVGGVWLTLLWFVHHVGGASGEDSQAAHNKRGAWSRPARHLLWLAPLFVVLGGLDILPNLFDAAASPVNNNHIEWYYWNQGLFQYSSMTTLLYWVPHHGLPGWLAGALFLQLRDDESLYRNSLLLGACVALWSFFAGLGLALLLITYCVIRPRLISAALLPLRQTLPRHIGGAVFIAAVLLYIRSNNFDIHSSFLLGEMLAAEGSANATAATGQLPRYLVALLVEFAIVGFCAALLLSGAARRFLIAVCVMLVLIPLYKVGYSHDLAMRASVPGLFVFWCLVVNALLHSNIPRRASAAVKLMPAAIAVCIALGVVPAYNEAYRAISKYTPPVTPLDHTLTVARIPPWGVGSQYLGHQESPLFRYLSPVVIDEGNPDLLHQAAAIRLKQYRNEEALELLNRRIDLGPDQPQAYYDRATVLMRLGRAEEAVQDYQTIDALDPEFLPTLTGYLVELGHPEDVPEYYQYRAMLEPNNADNYAIMGIGLLRLGNAAGAEQALRHALSLDPNHAQARFWMQRLPQSP